MKILLVIALLSVTVFCLSFNFQQEKQYRSLYKASLSTFREEQRELLELINSSKITGEKEKIIAAIHKSRKSLKSVDFWLRYFEPIAYRKINGPLPVEWENEVFEKFEPPYRREGGGLTLAELYLEEENPETDTLAKLIRTSIDAIATFEADSITIELKSPDHFFLANRLFLLNLGAIYTTSYECPDTNSIIPELRHMMKEVKEIYFSFSQEYPKHSLSTEYSELFEESLRFVNSQPSQFTSFDHFSFIKNFVNPLFAMNQQLIREYGVTTRNFNDFSLNNNSNSIFSKNLYNSQNTKGIFSLIEDEELLAEIKSMGRLLFYDPILSANNARSCASCHNPNQFFTDTTQATAFKFDHRQHLSRNTPSLVNSIFNHLVMLDGKHISLQDQARDVMHNPDEMNTNEKELLKKIVSCKEYKEAFKKFLKHTPEEKEVRMDHIISAITFYYADFSNYLSPFDEAMNEEIGISNEVKNGFNLFMSKAQCATCHFVPMFNGVKPPYIGTEFEVLGVPADTSFTKLSDDKGRYLVNPAKETLNAFRTTTVRNAARTAPYMHNGVFHSLEQVIDLYDGGGGIGRNLEVPNQTLSSDSLKLTQKEKSDLIAFMHSLSENVIFDQPPVKLPASSNKSLNRRKIGGEY